ncbi:MAG: SpoIIE family protein phosphatase [bacterium]|nr:SpoIIE family protein phosphatase [bacterium]
MEMEKEMKKFRSLAFKGGITLTTITLGLFVIIILIVNVRGKKLIIKESSRMIEKTGNKAIGDITIRSREIASLTRNLGAIAEKLPKDETFFHKVLPNVLDFNNDLAVAGGGVWPEPFQFHKNVERRSFFWGREKDGTFKYYDDYNKPGPGYHNEEWYVTVRYLKPGRPSWSISYVDPYSYQPMVTCTVATYEGDKIKGTVTIDLKLEGLKAFMDEVQKEMGGYVFLLDRNNKFLTFPKTKLVQKTTEDSKGNKTTDFIFVSDFTKKEPLFAPISKELEQMDKEILARASKMPGYRADLIEKIDKDSYQIDKAGAEYLAAVIADPLKSDISKTRLFKSFTIDNDFITKEKSIVYLFSIPDSYWKFVAVKPLSEAEAVATHITRELVLFMVVSILILIIVMTFIMFRSLVTPLNILMDGVKEISSGNLKNKVEFESTDELGKLAYFFNEMSAELLIHQENLEGLVEKRTQQLKDAMEELWGEMELAKKIQTVLLPQKPEIIGYDIAASLYPADEVGGDYFDVISEGGYNWIIIGDVSGHGVPAGLIMMMAQTAIHTVLTENPGILPSQLLTVINKIISNNVSRLGEDKYMTMTVLAVHKDGSFTFSGLHQDILVYRSNTKKLDIIETQGMWLGIQTDISDMNNVLNMKLDKGDCMLLYTDGLTEAVDKNGKMYGDDKLAEMIKNNGDKKASEIHKIINDSIESFETPDDVTLLVLKRL